MVHVDARISCQVIFHGANAYIFIYFNSISRVIKMNACLRILFMKRTQLKTKVACSCPSFSAVTKPQSQSLPGVGQHWWYRIPPIILLNWVCAEPCKACTLECPHPNWLSCHSKKYVFPSMLWSDFNGTFCTLGDRKYDKDPAFRKFKQQLYHSSISAILSTLKPAMLKPAVYRCPDGHFRRIIFGIGPFIADYPEQVMLAGIKQGWCPRCVSLSFFSSFHLLIPS